MLVYRNLINRASADFGMGDALNMRAFLITYCQQKHIRRNSIWVYAPKHWWMFEREGFLRGTRVKEFSNLTPYKNFGCINIKKRQEFLKLDVCISKNTGVNYTFDTVVPLPNYPMPNVQLPSEFITFNTGNGCCDPNDRSKLCTKTWPIEHWEKLIKLIDIPCVQIGSGPSCTHIPGAAVDLVDKLTIKQSAEVLRRAKFHIDIEGGLPILNQHLGKKSVVLFGPTSIHQQGRSMNLNIAAGTCNPCYEWVDSKYDLCVPRDQLKCNKHCMYDLTPELVINKMKEAAFL